MLSADSFLIALKKKLDKAELLFHTPFADNLMEAEHILIRHINSFSNVIHSV